MDYDAGKRLSKKVAEGVAPLLGDGWTFKDDPNHWGGTVLGPDGADLFFRMDGKRLQISGSYPHGTHQKVWGYEHHSITVSPDRSDEAIAKDIQRRLLPKYLPELANVLERLRLHDEGANAQAEVAKDLARVLGTTPGVGEVSIYRSEHGIYGRARILHGGNAVNLDLNGLTPEQAHQILTIITTA